MLMCHTDKFIFWPHPVSPSSPAISSLSLYGITMWMVLYFPGQTIVFADNTYSFYALAYILFPYLVTYFRNLKKNNLPGKAIFPWDTFHSRRVTVLSFILPLYFWYILLFLNLSQYHNILQCIPVTCLSLLPAVNLKLRENVIYLYVLRSKCSSCYTDDLSILV